MDEKGKWLGLVPMTCVAWGVVGLWMYWFVAFVMIPEGFDFLV